MQNILSPHGQSLDMAQWVVEQYSPLLHTDQYREHITMHEWVKQSQQIIDTHLDNDDKE